MPKRKQSASLEDDLDRLYKKMKKLEKKIRIRDESSLVTVPPPVPPPDPSADEELEWPGFPPPAASPAGNMPTPPANDASDDEPPVANDGEPLDSGAVGAQNDQSTPNPGSGPGPTSANQQGESVPPETISSEKSDADLDADVLAILGDDPSTKVKYGPEIRKELASRFQHIATEGLSKESRKELISKYPLPANCTYVGAPTINPEIKAALNESIIKRDKGIETKQNEMSSAISGLTEIITHYLNSKEKNNEVLQKLMDIGRILCDIQHGDSVTRRNFILFSVKNDMQEHLKSTKIDTSLFGEQLSETLKSAKAVNKSGAELKVDANKTNASKKPKPSPAQPLNRRAAPPRRPAGAASAPRGRQSAYPRAPPPTQPPPPPPPPPAYRTSSAPPPPPPRRRY